MHDKISKKAYLLSQVQLASPGNPIGLFLAHFGTLRRMAVAVFLPRLLTGLFSLSLRKKPFSIRDEAVTNRVE